MHHRARIDIAAFDPHPAFRLKRTFRSTPPAVRSLRARNPNVWPLPSIQGATPVVVSRDDDGVSLAWNDAAPLPEHVPVFAVSDGLVKYTSMVEGTNTLVLDHGDGHRSFYGGIDHLFVLRGTFPLDQPVKAGDVLGLRDTAPEGRSELYFTISKRVGHWIYAPTDPVDAMRDWLVLPWSDERVTPSPSTQLIAA